MVILKGGRRKVYLMAGWFSGRQVGKGVYLMAG